MLGCALLALAYLSSTPGRVPPAAPPRRAPLGMPDAEASRAAGMLALGERAKGGARGVGDLRMKRGMTWGSEWRFRDQPPFPVVCLVSKDPRYVTKVEQFFGECACAANTFLSWLQIMESCRLAVCVPKAFASMRWRP
jgi:hypothetical protein